MHKARMAGLDAAHLQVEHRGNYRAVVLPRLREFEQRFPGIEFVLGLGDRTAIRFTTGRQTSSTR